MNKLRIQQHLREFTFRQMFIEELGWDKPAAATEVTVDGQRFALPAIAHKRGMVAHRLPRAHIQQAPVRRGADAEAASRRLQSG